MICPICKKDPPQLYGHLLWRHSQKGLVEYIIEKYGGLNNE